MSLTAGLSALRCHPEAFDRSTGSPQASNRFSASVWVLVTLTRVAVVFDPRFDDEPPLPPMRPWRARARLECEPGLIHWISETIVVPWWHKAAACRGVDSAIFFLGPGHPATEAKAICAGCPVQPACLDWAVDNKVTLGIFGGQTPIERRDERKRRKQLGTLVGTLAAGTAQKT